MLILLRVLDREKILTVATFCFLNPIAPFNELEPKKTSSYTILDVMIIASRFDLVYTILDICTPVPSLCILWRLLIVIIVSVCVS